MRIGIDIDGVLADSLPLWVHTLNSFFNKNKRVEDIHLYDIIKTFDITPAELKTFIEQHGQFLMVAPGPVNGAAYCLNLLKRYHSIYIVTARNEAYRPETQSWLQRYGMLYDKLILIGSHKKADTCLKYGLDVMVEDTLEVGLEISAAGIPVILLNASYNQGDLPERICRKYSWFEIFRALMVETVQPDFIRGSTMKTVSPPACSVEL